MNFDWGVDYVIWKGILLNEVKLKAALKIQHCLQFIIACDSIQARNSGRWNLNILKINKR